jgi:predicted dehydrogenase
MSSQDLRIGVVGLGYAGSAAMEGFSALPGVSLHAIAGLETPRLELLGDKYGVPRRYARWEDMLAAGGLDAISVATPTHLHAPIAIAALEAGLHVLCEKPLARSVEEGRAMVAAAEKAGRVLQVVFNHRERGDVAALKQQVDAGQLGRIYYAKAHWMRRNGIPGLGGWFTSRELAGGGPLIDLGVHILDLALYLLGEPRVMTASASTFAELGPRGLGGADTSVSAPLGSAFEVEDLATAYLRLEDGAALHLETSWATFRAPGDNFGIELYGTEGGARIEVQDYRHGDTLRIFTDVAGVPAEVRPAVGKGEGHRAVVREFVEIVRSGTWTGHTGTAALRRTQVIESCYRSALDHREVAVDG